MQVGKKIFSQRSRKTMTFYWLKNRARRPRTDHVGLKSRAAYAQAGLPFAWAWKYRGNRKSVGLWRKISSFSLFRLLLVNVSSHFSHAGSMSCQSAVGRR